MYHAIESNAGGGYETRRVRGGPVETSAFSLRVFFSFFFFFSANQLNHRPFLSFYRARARFGFTFLVIMHYYPPGRIYRNSAFNATTTTTTRPPLPGKRLNASRVR